MKKFYLHNGTEQQGPFDVDDLKIKNITKATPIWYEELTDWTAAENIEELKILFQSATPPPLNKINHTPPSIIPLDKSTDKTQSETTTIPSAKSLRQKNKTKLILYTVGGVLLLGIITFTISKYPRQKEEQHTVQPTQKVEKQEGQTQEQEIQKAREDAANQEKENQIRQKEIEEEKKRKQIENAKRNLRNNWSEYIKVERSSYTYREIGGIYDLYITLTNNTAYTLDNVETQISYIKTNGDIYKTETIVFNGIAPHYSKKLKAPDSNRGTSVDYLQITGISSDALNFCYAPGNWANNSPDPYKCQ